MMACRMPNCVRPRSRRERDATLTPVSSGYADVNGTRFWYEVAGSGPALVMAHGHLIDSGQWDGQMAAFAAEYRAIRYDARGFGRSDAQAGPFSLSEDLRGLLGFLGGARAVLGGCSGGGMSGHDLAPARRGRGP